MKKTIVMVLCLVLALSFVGCGSNKDKKDGDKKEGDTTVKIEGVVYYNTKRAISVEPDERVIVNEELPLNGSISDEKITAYAFINDEKLGEILVCLTERGWAAPKGSLFLLSNNIYRYLHKKQGLCMNMPINY